MNIAKEIYYIDEKLSDLYKDLEMAKTFQDKESLGEIKNEIESLKKERANLIK